MKSVLCLDLGASSGRAIIVTNNNCLELNEVHRFPTKTLNKNGKIYWDLPYILNEIKIGIKKALKENSNIQSLGIDTWGCDYGWLDENGQLFRNPRSYRTCIPQKVIDEVHNKISLEEHYNICGNGHFAFNSIYQLYYDIKYENILESGAKEFLFMPNLILYYLTGEKVWEYTIASTSGLLNAENRDWSKTIFQKLEIPSTIKGELTHPGTTSYFLKDEILKELDISQNIPIVCVPGHDSACAVIGANLDNNSAYLINGTWSLLGVELSKTITDLVGLKKGLVNEGSLEKKIRFMSMTIGTLPLQSLRNQWKKENENIDFKDFSNLAKNSILNNHIEITEEFLITSDIENLIKDKYFKKYRCVINSKEDILRIIYNSLGNNYRESLELIKTLSNKEINNVVLLGGGNQDSFLIEIIRKSFDCSIIIGPIEASVTGNALIQFKSL